MSDLRVEIADGIGRIVLDRPDAKNALTAEMRDGITDAVRSFRTDPAVRAVLVTGSGDAFCAGMDLSASTVTQAGKPGFTPRSTSEALRAGVQSFIRELWELDKPTVAAVNGAAVGPGAHLALACDFVLVHPRTRFLWSFAKWGLVVDAGGAYLLPRLVGLPRAKAMVMLGEGATGADVMGQAEHLDSRELGIDLRGAVGAGAIDHQDFDLLAAFGLFESGQSPADSGGLVIGQQDDRDAKGKRLGSLDRLRH